MENKHADGQADERDEPIIPFFICTYVYMKEREINYIYSCGLQSNCRKQIKISVSIMLFVDTTENAMLSIRSKLVGKSWKARAGIEPVSLER